MEKHYQIKLRCATCGGENFESNEDKSYLKCTKCGREYFRGKEELLEYNQEAKDELLKQVKRDAENKIKESFKNFLK